MVYYKRIQPGTVRWEEMWGMWKAEPSLRKHFPKSPGVHQPRSFHPPLSLASSSNSSSSPWAKPSDTPPALFLLPCRDLRLLTSTCLLCWLLICTDTHSRTIHPHWKYHFSATPTVGHTSFSTHRETSRETCSREGFLRRSKVLILPVFLSLWPPHPLWWAAFRGWRGGHRVPHPCAILPNRTPTLFRNKPHGAYWE